MNVHSAGVELITKKKPPNSIIWIALPFVMVLFFLLLPRFLHVPVNATGQIRVYYRGELYPLAAQSLGGELYLPLDFFRDNFDNSLHYDKENEVVIITAERQVFHLPVGTTGGLLNLEPYDFTYPAVEVEGCLYLPADPLKDIYDLEIKEEKDNQLACLFSRSVPRQGGIVLKNSKLRGTASFWVSWIFEVFKGERVFIQREENGWYWVETDGGKIGYIEKGKVELAGIVSPSVPKETPLPWNPLGQSVVLAWEQIGTRAAKPETGNLQGVNVISPTWFHLTEDGLVVNRADKGYVQWAHENGRQVWALFSNSFDPELTHTFLNDSALRVRAIKQILSYVELYQLDGINLDFENMYLKDKDAYVRFVKELAPLLHAKERALTIDVTFHSKSENWSLCYDRPGLAEAADYLVIMGYDEHGQGSKTAGSVSSLPWVEAGIIKMLAEVAPEKLILGVPFYTRLWSEERGDDGGRKTTSQALSMEKAEEWVAARGVNIRVDEAAGQHYAEIQEGNTTYKMWLEDDFSLKKRVELMKKYRMAGLAAWKRGFEKKETWPTLAGLIDSRW